MTSNDSEPMILDRDYSLLGDDLHHAELVEYPGWEGPLGFAKTQPLKTPDVVYFVGNIESIREIDFPENNVRWPIMSKRMLQVLKSIGNFEHREIPVAFLDDRVSLDKMMKGNEKPKAEYMLEGFSAVQILTQIDAFDWENSKYEASAYDSTLVEKLRYLKLLPVSDGYPPLFRLFAYPTRDFVSSDAAMALQDAGIVGTSLAPLGDYPPRPR